MDSDFFSHVVLWTIGVISAIGAVGAIGALFSLGRTTNYNKH